MGLQGLAEGVLRLTISKDPSVRIGNWEADRYSEEQIEYAANDATVSVDIFTHLVLAKIRQRRPHLTDDEIFSSEDQFWKTAQYMCQGTIDVIYRGKANPSRRMKPSGRPKDDSQGKENICVVCGETGYFQRKFVIPKEYTKYYPQSIKEHSSQDALLMCESCHMKSTEYDIILRQKLADQCAAPIDSGSGIKLTYNVDLGKVKSAANALKNKTKENIPEKRLLELEKIVRDFYGETNITDDLLKEASKINCMVYNTGYVPHGESVVKYMRDNEGLYEFQKMWRKHFVDTMKPQFMPSKWSVEHKSEHHDTPTSD